MKRVEKHKNYKNDILQYKQDYVLKNNREATTLEFLHLLYNNYVDKQNDYFTTTIAKSFFTVMQNQDNQGINTLATDLDTYEIIKMLNSTEKPLVRYEIDEKDKDVLVPIGNYTNKKYEHHKIKVKDIQNSKSDKQVLDAVVNIIGKEFVNTVFKKHLNNNKSILLKLKQRIFDNVIKEKNNYKHLIEEARTYLQNNQSKVFMSGIIESNNDKKKTAIKSKSQVKKNQFFRLEKNTTIEDIFNKINNKSNQKPSNNNNINLIDDDSIQEGINSNIINNNININLNKYKKKNKNKVRSSSQINIDKKYNQKDNFLIGGIINNNSNININTNNIQKQNTNVLKKENIIPEKRAEDNSKNSKKISKNNINNGNVYENNLMNSTSKKNNAQQYQ